MKGFTAFCLVVSLGLLLGVASESAMAQYTGEVVVCAGSDPANPPSAEDCRAGNIPPSEDGAVHFDRAALGPIICAGAGFVPQETACNFTGSSYLGSGCTIPLNQFEGMVPAGGDMWVACSDSSPLPPGNYSARATSSSCFEPGVGDCVNLAVEN